MIAGDHDSSAPAPVIEQLVGSLPEPELLVREILAVLALLILDLEAAAEPVESEPME